MDFTITANKLIGGEVGAPASKSQSQRALLLAAMASGRSELTNVLGSPDTLAMKAACEAIGAKFVRNSSGVLCVEGVSGSPQMIDATINVCGSGQVLRFFSAVALCSENSFNVVGDSSVSSLRRMCDFVGGVAALGVGHTYLRNTGYAPINFSGVLSPGVTSVSGCDSQVVSALMLAASYLDGVTTIKVSDPGEQPWVDLTQAWLPGAVKKVQVKNQLHYTVIGERQKAPLQYSVPGDFSSIAYLVAAAAIVGVKLTVSGLDWNDLQGDKIFIDTLINMDGNKVIEKTAAGLCVHGKARFVADVTIDVNDCIDMVTIVAVIACFAAGETKITGAGIARQKESDRLLAMGSELKKMGANIQVNDDGFVIVGGPLFGADLLSWSDHRIAMALSVAALGAQDDSIIRGADCVKKSYPGFYSDLKKLGAGIEVL
jgi:3-phosphoshikimate 1-carboxyvinyltransferase